MDLSLQDDMIGRTIDSFKKCIIRDVLQRFDDLPCGFYGQDKETGMKSEGLII